MYKVSHKPFVKPSKRRKVQKEAEKKEPSSKKKQPESQGQNLLPEIKQTWISLQRLQLT